MPGLKEPKDMTGPQIAKRIAFLQRRIAADTAERERLIDHQVAEWKR